MKGTDLASCEAVTRGLVNDRRWAVMHPDGRIATRREVPNLALLSAVPTDYGVSISYAGQRLDVKRPTEVARNVTLFSDTIENVLDAGNFASHFLSSALEQEVCLVYFPEEAKRPLEEGFAPANHHTAFADGYPLLITTTASLQELNAELETPVDMRRFRPNIVIDGALEPWAEDQWRRVRIGSTILRIVKPCSRCVMVLQDPVTGEKVNAYEPLRTLRRIHQSAYGKVIFGQNAVVETPGSMVMGDSVEILETGQSNLL